MVTLLCTFGNKHTPSHTFALGSLQMCCFLSNFGTLFGLVTKETFSLDTRCNDVIEQICYGITNQLRAL